MAIKNTLLGGTDYTGERMYSADLNATFNATFNYFAQYNSSDLGNNANTPAGTINNSTTETVLASTTITADTVTTGIIVFASCDCARGSALGQADFRIYAGENNDGSFGSNTEYRQITLTPSASGNKLSTMIMYYITGLTWSNTNYVQVTCQLDNNDGADIGNVKRARLDYYGGITMNILGSIMQWLHFKWPSVFDRGLKTWWDNAWSRTTIKYNTESNGYEDVRTVLYTSGEGWIGLTGVADALKITNTDGSLSEDGTFRAIQRYVNDRVEYVEDIKQYGKNEYWQDAWETHERQKGDCDDVAILIKMLTLAAGIPDYRVKCCCLDIYHPKPRQYAGGHMNILYLSRNWNIWQIKEGTWYQDRPDTYGDIWFTFNRENSWAQHSLEFDRSKLRRRAADEVLNND